MIAPHPSAARAGETRTAQQPRHEPRRSARRTRGRPAPAPAADAHQNCSAAQAPPAVPAHRPPRPQQTTP